MPRMIVVGSGIAGLFTALCARRGGVRDVAVSPCRGPASGVATAAGVEVYS